VGGCLKPVLDVLRDGELDVGLNPSALLAGAGGANRVQAALSDLAMDELAEEHATIPERILRLLLYPDEAVVIYPTEDFQTGERRTVFRLVDPTSLLTGGYSPVHASLSMSGTLAAPADGDSELRYQVPLFGLPLRETLPRKYASPFPLRNQRWIYCTDTYGTYRRRGDYLERYAEHIVDVGQATPGVTAVFFSSYAFLQQVGSAIADPAEQALITAEDYADVVNADGDGGDVSDYEQRLRALMEEHGRAYLFAVYQGKLAEGADFRDNLIKTVICVSIPMEYPVLFHECLEALYAQRFLEIAEGLGDDPEAKAHEYALDRYSLSLVLQACGRGIRSGSDRCVFLLLDRRYHEYDWRRFLEPRPYNVLRPETNVSEFQRVQDLEPGFSWDAALVACDGKRGSE
jgi:Rad3-related DNA helicase